MDAEERKKELMAQNRVKDGMMFKLDWDPRIIGSRQLPDGTVKKAWGTLSGTGVLTNSHSSLMSFWEI